MPQAFCYRLSSTNHIHQSTAEAMRIGKPTLSRVLSTCSGPNIARHKTAACFPLWIITGTINPFRPLPRPQARIRFVGLNRLTDRDESRFTPPRLAGLDGHIWCQIGAETKSTQTSGTLFHESRSAITKKGMTDVATPAKRDNNPGAPTSRGPKAMDSLRIRA
jgi:hypothetical protein